MAEPLAAGRRSQKHKAGSDCSDPALIDHSGVRPKTSRKLRGVPLAAAQEQAGSSDQNESRTGRLGNQRHGSNRVGAETAAFSQVEPQEIIRQIGIVGGYRNEHVIARRTGWATWERIDPIKWCRPGP